MSAVALRCDADADRMLAQRERFAEVFPVTGSAGDGAGGDAGKSQQGADGLDAAVSSRPWRTRALSRSPRRRGVWKWRATTWTHQGGRVISSAIGEQERGGWRPRTEDAWCGWPWRVSAPM